MCKPWPPGYGRLRTFSWWCHTWIWLTWTFFNHGQQVSVSYAFFWRFDRPWLKNVQCEHFIKVVQGSCGIENSSNHIENGKTFRWLRPYFLRLDLLYVLLIKLILANASSKNKEFLFTFVFMSLTFLSTLFLILRLRLEVKYPKFLAMVKITTDPRTLTWRLRNSGKFSAKKYSIRNLRISKH